VVRVSLLLLGTLLLSSNGAMTRAAAPQTDGPTYTSDGQLKRPEQYREWAFLTSGVNMSYDPKAQADGHPFFDNVFVNPSAYQVFQQTGTWPDKTALVLENRNGESGRSINTHGQTQSVEVTGLEVHVKDATLAGGWGFYVLGSAATAKRLPHTAACYTCHEQHAAVDTTFVQFYPTLLPLAQQKATLSAAYLKEIDAAPAK
jgi:hypothetical protein